MVCSSTLRANAVTHATKRRYPSRVKAQTKGRSSACQIDQRSVASVMGASPNGAGCEGDHPAGSARQMPRTTGYRGLSRWPEVIAHSPCRSDLSRWPEVIAHSPCRSDLVFRPFFGVQPESLCEDFWPPT